MANIGKATIEVRATEIPYVVALLRLAGDLVAACEANGFHLEITEAYREAERRDDET